MRYTITHSDWNDEFYGWQTRKDGKLLDTYEDKDMAIVYVDYMNNRAEERANELGELRANLTNGETV